MTGPEPAPGEPVPDRPHPTHDRDDGVSTPDDLPLAGTRAGRRLLTVVLIAVVGAMLLSNLPSTAVTDRLAQFQEPITDVTGLGQNWALFAPVPRSTTLQLRAEIERADGTVDEWTPPTGDPFVGVYRTYRWRKWSGAVVVPRNTRLHRGAANYLQHRAEADGGALPVEIRLYRGVFRQPPSGSGEPLDRDPPFEEELLHTWVRPGGDDVGDARDAARGVAAPAAPAAPPTPGRASATAEVAP